MRLTGVVFDLFHTLVDTEHLRADGFDELTSIAAISGVEHGSLSTFWTETYLERETTTIDLVDLVQRWCDGVGVRLSPAQRVDVDAVLGVCKDEALRSPVPAIVSLLGSISDDVPIGVLSNCHEREVRHWAESPLAPHVSAFGRSSRIGVMKPHPLPYRWILEKIRGDAGTSIYVGNGSSDELLGAREAGFGTVVHCNVFDRTNGLVPEAEQRRRAGQADLSVDTIDEMTRAVSRLTWGPGESRP